MHVFPTSWLPPGIPAATCSCARLFPTEGHAARAQLCEPGPGFSHGDGADSPGQLCKGDKVGVQETGRSKDPGDETP
jgi:hypothetical protein